jgi:hypothetical protein
MLLWALYLSGYRERPRRKFSDKAFPIQLVIHIVCVGIPVSLTQSRYGGNLIS